MRVFRSPAEREQILRLIQTSDTFRNVFYKDWTQIVLDDLYNRMYGRIPRNFLINVSGLIGTPTGIFKSSMGLQLALLLDPLFSVKERVAFSINQLLEKIRDNTEFYLCNSCYHQFCKEYSGSYELNEEETEHQCNNCDNVGNKLILLTRLIFFLDEQTKTLKHGGIVRLMNIVDTARQRQLCFITCGVQAYGMHYTTYQLQRVQESADDYLPQKRVRYGVYDDERDIYYGYFNWDITPLSNEKWCSIWSEYSKMKTEFQRVAISQQIQSMNMEEFAEEVMNDDQFPKCLMHMRDGSTRLSKDLAKNLIFKHFPDITTNERDMILSEIQLLMKDNEVDEDDEDI